MIKRARVIQIGNSKGVRIPKPMILRAGLDGEVVIEEVNGGIFIHSTKSGKLSWEDTYREMAASGEDWSDWADVDLEDMHED